MLSENDASDTLENNLLLDEKNTKVNDRERKAFLKRELSLTYCISFVLGGMIGSGIFVAPSLVAKRTPNTFVAMCIWIIAAFISFLGCLSYVEVVSVIRKTGGAFIIVYESYGKCAGFLILWMSLLVLNPFGFNVLMLTCGTYICSLFIEDKNSKEFFWLTRLVGLLILYIIAFICCMGVKISGVVQKIITCVQITAVLLLAIAGIYNLCKTGDFNNFKPETVFKNTLSGIKNDIPTLGTALFTALFCFDGWTFLIGFVEEIKNPKKNMLLLAGSVVPSVGILYIFVNLAALACLSHAQMGSTLVLFEDIFDVAGMGFLKYVVPILVSISCVGTILGGFFHRSRFLMSAAREGLLPKFLSLIHPKKGSAIPSVILICITTTATLFMCLNLEDTMHYFNVAMWIEYGVGFSTVLYWRYKEPHTDRCYRVWITTPILMMMIAIALALSTFLNLHRSAIFFSVTLISGLFIYYVCIMRNHLKLLKIDRFSDWIVKHTNLVVNEFNETGWK